MLEFFNYETLRLIWWLILGFLLIGFAITDGFDLGVGILLPFLAKNDREKRIMINSIGPVWEGNQVWLILGAGASFAAWPYIYAVSFSGFYFAMLLALLALILRPVGFDYRDKIENSTWKKIWDSCLFFSGLIPTFVFGIAVGNLFHGLAFGFNEFMVIENKIHFFSLFTPFSFLCATLSVTLFITHGAAYLAIKTENEILRRANFILKIFPFFTIILFALGAKLVSSLPCYQLTEFAGTLAESDPLNKKVIIAPNCWLENYHKYQWMMIAPTLGFLGQILVLFFASTKAYGKAFIASAISIFGIIANVGLVLFPFILPSNLNPNASLTVWDASSSNFTLFVMLIATIIFMPLILLYTSIVYKTLRGKVKENNLTEE